MYRWIESLPRTLGEAIQVAEGSELLKKALGEHAFRLFLKNKKIEWERYCSTVTDFDRNTYLPLL